MSTSQRTFNQVKSILGKLDQRIDNLRAARTTERILPGLATAAGASPASGPNLSTTIGHGHSAAPVQAKPVPAPIAPSAPAAPAAPSVAPKSIYGRATPIRPTGT
jgi:hypothetical protein